MGFFCALMLKFTNIYRLQDPMPMLSNLKYYFIYFNTTLYKTYNINGFILAFNTIK